MQTVNVLLFDEYKTLDALGPSEVLARLKDNYSIRYISQNGGMINGSARTQINTNKINDISNTDILLLPGGFGTRKLVNDKEFLTYLRNIAEKSEITLSVCTGSALLAKAGVLSGKRATSNKLSWDWVISQSTDVKWIRKARWVVDGKYYSSSGITAGIDMALGFIADKHNIKTASEIAKALEYIWNNNKDEDQFA